MESTWVVGDIKAESVRRIKIQERRKFSETNSHHFEEMGAICNK